MQEDLKPYNPSLYQEPDGHALDGIDQGWERWLRVNFPHVVSQPFAARHRRVWNWFDDLKPGVAPQAAVEVWPRGGGKSSTGELACAWTGAKVNRRFVLYISNTQEQADKHVQAVGTLFERLGVGRLLSKFGGAKAGSWKRDQLRTDNGFNVASLGLKEAVRGVKLDNFRPDLIIFDDIDGLHDTESTTKKKIETITHSILPAGSIDCAVIFLQNLIKEDGIVDQLVTGKADFLRRRYVSPVEPAVFDLEYELTPSDHPNGKPYHKITAGSPSWQGQDLATCEFQMNLWGVSAFLVESQHRVDLGNDGIWCKETDIEPFRVVEAPTLNRIMVGLDPNTVGNRDGAGIIVAGTAHEYQGKATTLKHAYILKDASIEGSPLQWARQAVTELRQWKAAKIIAEANQGGQMVLITLSTIKGDDGKQIVSAATVELVHASTGKVTRAQPIQALYGQGRCHHVGEFPELERQMGAWRPGDPSPNNMDAAVWVLSKLMLDGEPTAKVQRPQGEKRAGFGFV